jgi:SAM-dependent methyltransferase
VITPLDTQGQENLKPYAESFFVEHRGDSLSSAEAIVSWIIGLISPKSVVDVGCGTGTWLSIFQKYGVRDIIGIDGEWVPKGNLEIPSKYFRAMDLCRPAEIGRQFDLVISLEVAEHLAPTAADEFISYLTSLGPVVLFSAAIPDQGGTGHLNEQWPAYWNSLFQKKDYKCIDCVRGNFWAHDDVAPWYIQNMFFFVRQDRINLYSNLLEQEARFSFGSRSIVHPGVYYGMAKAVERLSNPESYSIKEFVKVFPTLLLRAIRLRLKAFYMKLSG